MLINASQSNVRGERPTKRGRSSARFGDSSSGGNLQESLLQRLRYVDGKEAIGSIAVVLSTLVDDTQIAMALCLPVKDDAIQLPPLERGLVALVLDAHSEPYWCLT